MVILIEADCSALRIAPDPDYSARSHGWPRKGAQAPEIKRYPCDKLVSSPYAAVIMLLHMAVIAYKAGRRVIDTEMFGDDLIPMLDESVREAVAW